MSRMGKSIGTESGSIVARHWGRKGVGVTANGYGVSFGAMKIF